MNDTEYANNYIRFKPAGAAYIDHNTVGQDINFRTSVSSSLDTTPVIIKSGGNVGIGTDIPTGRLSVALANSSTPQFRLESPTSDVDFAISNYNDSAGTYVSLGVNHNFNSSGNDAVMDTNKKSSAIVLDGRNNGRIQFLTGSTGIAAPRMTVLQDGKVGIGTSDPQALLELSKTTAGLITGGTGNTGPVLRLHHEAQWENGYTGGDFLGAIDFSTGDASTGEGVKSSIRATVDNYYNTSSLAFFTTASSGSTTLTERLRIENGGEVGIGTPNPAYKLDVGHTGSGAIQARFKSSGDTGYTQGAISLESGTSDGPESRGQGVYMFNEGTDRTWYAGTPYGGTAGQYGISTVAGTTMQTSAAANGNLALVINSNKNVGIGTSSPNVTSHTKLEVHGAIAAGSTQGTGGSLVLYQRYGVNDMPATLSTHYSNSYWFLATGMKARSGAAGYVSSLGNYSTARAGIDVNNSAINFLYVPAATVAVDTVVTPTYPMQMNLATSDLRIAGGAPTVTLNASGQATNKKMVRIAVSQYTAGDFNIQQMNDNGTTVALNALQVNNGGELIVAGTASLKGNSLTIDSDYGHWSGRHQTLVCHNAITASQVWTDVAFVSYSPSLTIQGTSQRDNAGNLGMASFFGTIFGGYGSVTVTATTNIARSMNGGGFGQLEYRYNNGTAPSGVYRLQVRQAITAGTMYITTTLNGQAFSQITED